MNLKTTLNHLPGDDVSNFLNAEIDGDGLIIDSLSAAAENSDTNRLLYDRKSAALQLSISVRALDYLIAGGKLATRRIGAKVLVPHKELVRFASADHRESVAA